MINRLTLPLFAVPFSMVICAVGTVLVRRWSLARGFADRPGGHKGHAVPIALGGGIAVTLAVILPMLLGILTAAAIARRPPDWLPAMLSTHLDGIVSKIPTAVGICVGAVAMCILGLLDDRRPLSPGLRLVVQAIIAAALVVGFDLRLLSHLPSPVSIGLSMLWILILTNSLNFLDNMDGLAAGVAAIAASVFAVTAMLADQIFVPTCCWLLVGALLGFLPYNFHPASIYVGDAGSTVIGFLLAVFTILTTFTSPAQGDQPIGVVAPLVVMAVPLYDTASVFYLRWRIGVPVWTGDRRHFSHRLVRRGMSVRKAVVVIWLATLVTALPALWLPKATWLEACGIGIQTILVVILVALLESAGPRDENT